MGNVSIIKKEPEIYEYTQVPPVFGAEDYRKRIEMLLKRLAAEKCDFVVVYGDREHFANIEYFSGYDPRYEEALLVLDADGRATLVVGGEGWGYSFKVPITVNRVLYPNFSPQGQSREGMRSLSDIFRDCGIRYDSKVGIIGYKYFESGDISDCQHKYDVPAYILDELFEVADKSQARNITRFMTNPKDGLRTCARTAKEIAYFEYRCGMASMYVYRMLKCMRPNISERELSIKAEAYATPIGMFPIVTFGENLSYVFASPGEKKLRIGEVAGLSCAYFSAYP